MTVRFSISNDDNSIGSVKTNKKKLAKEYNLDINGSVDDPNNNSKESCKVFIKPDEVPVHINGSAACQEKYGEVFAQILGKLENLSTSTLSEFLRDMTFQLHYIPEEKRLKTFFCKEGCNNTAFIKK